MTSLLEILTKGTSYLEKRGVDSPRLNMELMAAHVLEMQRMQLYLEFDRPLAEEQLVPLRDMLRRRGEREPLQHILGETNFYGRDFICDARALIPRPETEELVAHVLKLDLPEAPRILDLCCGSGVIGLTLQAELPQAAITLADLSEDALALTRENAQALGLSVDVVLSDSLAALTDTYDLIVCNPPYVAAGFPIEAEVQHDPAMALFSGEDGLDFIRALIPAALRVMNPQAWIALEVGYDQGAHVTSLMTSAGYTAVTLAADLEGVQRFPMGQKA